MKLITCGNEQLSIILPFPQLFDFSELLHFLQLLNLSIFPTSSFFVSAHITSLFAFLEIHPPMQFTTYVFSYDFVNLTV